MSLDETPPPARRTDPGTTWRAARAITSEHRITQAERALRVIVQAGSRGATCADVVARLGTDRGCTARRITDARVFGWVRADGDRLARTGHRQTVWRATSSGHKRVAELIAAEAAQEPTG